MDRIYSKAAGIDVHKKIVVCTILKVKNNKVTKETRQFKTFKNELTKLAKWLKSNKIEIVAMESTSVYWFTVYESIEDYNIPTIVINARYIKNVPGRKTDILDSEWIAELLLSGLLKKKSFIPTRDIRELRVLTRYRTKLVSMLASEKNRLGKYLDSTGIRLSSVVTDIDGVSAKLIIDALLKGELSPKEISKLAKGKLKLKKEDIILSLEGRLSDRHRFVLKKIRNHLEFLLEDISDIDEVVVKGMEPYKEAWEFIQTIPGFDSISAAMLLCEIGTDMSEFKNSKKICAWAGVSPGINESAGKKNPQKQQKEISM